MNLKRAVRTREQHMSVPFSPGLAASRSAQTGTFFPARRPMVELVEKMSDPAFLAGSLSRDGGALQLNLPKIAGSENPPPLKKPPTYAN